MRIQRIVMVMSLVCVMGSSAPAANNKSPPLRPGGAIDDDINHFFLSIPSDWVGSEMSPFGDTAQMHGVSTWVRTREGKYIMPPVMLMISCLTDTDSDPDKAVATVGARIGGTLDLSIDFEDLTAQARWDADPQMVYDERKHLIRLTSSTRTPQEGKQVESRSLVLMFVGKRQMIMLQFSFPADEQALHIPAISQIAKSFRYYPEYSYDKLASVKEWLRGRDAWSGILAVAMVLIILAWRFYAGRRKRSVAQGVTAD